VRVGIVFNLHASYPWRDGDPPDADAEYEPVETVEALETALQALGHEPVRVGTPHDLLTNGPGAIDAAVNIAEGARTRNREAWAPILLEMWGIPCIGSDALALSLSLDKVLTKQVLATAGVRTPAFAAYGDSEEVTPSSLPAPFPLFVKPRYEGTAKGIRPSSVVHTLEELRREVMFVNSAYRQEALVEAFVSGGGEFTVAVVGAAPPQALPVLQRALDSDTGIGLHAISEGEDRAWELPGVIHADLEEELARLSLEAFSSLGCRDFARIDFRVDEDGLPWFLEINPLPTFAPDGTFAVIAELAGRDYPDFLAEVLEGSLSRALARHPQQARVPL
jgi:D-alanine-D-alanine ligase